MRTLAAVAGLLAGAAAAETPPVLTADQAIARDAAEYAAVAGIPEDEALRRLRFQEASVDAVAALESRFSDRLAGVVVEQRPSYRLVVLLTGSVPVPPESVRAAGTEVPVEFRTGARATHAQLLDAIALHQEEIEAMLPRMRGVGVDPRSGSVVVMLNASDAAVSDRLVPELEALTGVPVTIHRLDRAPGDFAVEGGARVTGRDVPSGGSFLCTTGFALRGPNGYGVATAAHCPDELTYRDPAGTGSASLPYVGQWGVRFRDVQVNLVEAAPPPLFFADAAKRELRPVLGARSRGTLHAGQVVCHRGEKSGYSCAEIDLVDFAPPPPLCAGTCDPVWVTVAGPSCRGGDSGGPVFVGATAVGIVKGGAYDADRRCHFYFFMSLDYLPDGWQILIEKQGERPTTSAAVRIDAPSPPPEMRMEAP